MNFLSRALKLYSEAATGKVEQITIGEISSSDPLMFLGISATTVLAFSGSIKWLLAAVKTSLEIRELWNKGKAAGLSDAQLKGIHDAVNDRLEQAVDDRVKYPLI